MKLTQRRRALNKKLIQYQAHISAIKTEKQVLKEAKQLVKAAVIAQSNLQLIAQEIQEHVHQKIAAIVTKCLEAIFGSDSYGFQFRFERKRGKTEAMSIFTRDDEELDDPLHMSGGGPVSVAAFALRVAMIVLARPAKRRLIVLDEPFSMLSESNAAKIGVLLKALSEELDLQVIMVTHMESLKIGEVVEIGN